MNKKAVWLMTMFFGLTASVYAQTTVHDNFLITQTNPVQGSSTVGSLIQTTPEIAYFEDSADIGLCNFITGDIFGTYSASLVSSGISGANTAAEMLGITSTSALSFSATSSASMTIASFDGTNHVFDPLFSNYSQLVFDVQNVGASAVDFLFRIGPNSSSAIYSSLDEFYMPITQNIVTVAPDETATFIFYLGLLVDDPSVVWDYANDPYSEFSLEVQPQGIDSGFDIIVDNVGMVPVPEPGSVMLCLFGFVISKLAWRKNK